MTIQGTISREEAKEKLERTGQYVEITNSTSEKILVYGPPRETDGGKYDTSWYVLHPNQTTPAWWECDGWFVPTDRSFKSEKGKTAKGPVAIKYNPGKAITITKERDQYIVSGDSDDGIFHASEINWSIPDFSVEDCQDMVRLMYQIPK
jgi:hypothetical protein